jgi:hypothetical protein
MAAYIRPLVQCSQAARGHSQGKTHAKLRQQEVAPAPVYFKLSKFKKVPPKLVIPRGTRDKAL